ncbi:DNA-binding transcriptional LysR family regulator [Pseudomonas oryzihabitans]
MTSWPFMVEDELRLFPIPGRFACSSAEGVQEACLQEMGLAMLSYWDVEAEAATGRLRSIAFADAEAQNLPIWALMPSSKSVPTRVRLLIDDLRRCLQTAPSAAGDSQSR